MESLLFRNDKRLRDTLYTPESYQHPAKANLYMMQAIIEKYTLPGDTILDPMGGVGSTMIAALMGRNVVLVELEPHFLAPMRASWGEKMRQHPMLGYTLGEVLILRGDARCLPLGRADTIITSPPYENAVGDNKEGPGQTSVPGGWKANTVNKHGGYTRSVDAVISSPPFQDQLPAQDPEWFAQHRHEFGGGSIPGNSYTRPVDAVVSSPPYENAVGTGEGPGAAGPKSGMWDGPGQYSSSAPRYTRPVDAVVTSPPYEGVMTQQGGDTEEAIERWVKHKNEVAAKAEHWPGGRDYGTPGRLAWVRGVIGGYGATENIGNQRGDAYWESMRQVYQECHRVLRPGGIMALVLKGFTRDGQYVNLPQQTAALCESLGFTLFDEWQRELWSLSFWRILQKRRDPAAFDERLKYESILAFRKVL